MLEHISTAIPGNGAILMRSERGSRPALILRSGPKDRVSKDEGEHLTMMASVLKGEGGLMLRDAGCAGSSA
jgi:hypothetical protein